MERDWERTNARQEIDLDGANAVLDRFGLRAVSVEPLLGGKMNTNLKVVLASGRVAVLRLHTGGAADAAREFAIAGLVAGAAPVPQVIAGDVSAGVSLLEWVDGDRWEDVDGPSFAEPAYAAGATLARIHDFTFPASGFFGPDLAIVTPFGDVAAGYLGHAEALLGGALVRQRLGEVEAARVAEWIESHRHLLEPIAGQACLVHGDYKPSNLLVRQAAVTGVLDWEFAHAASGLTDLGNLLRHERSYPPEFAAEVERGYRDADGDLPPDWRSAARLLDLVSLLGFLARESAGPNLLRGCLDPVKQTVG